MLGRNSSLAALNARKRLLILESEVHRAQLAQDWSDLHGCVGALREKAKPVGKAISIAGMLIAAATAYSQIRHGKGSFLSRLLSSGSVLATIFKFAGQLGAR